MYLPPKFFTHLRIHDRSVFETAARLQKTQLFDCGTGDLHHFTNEDPDRTVLKTYIVAPSASPEWVFNLESLLNSVDAATQGEREPVAHNASISMPDGYDQDQAAALAFRVASYVAWKFNVPVSVTLCHEQDESVAVEEKSQPTCFGWFEANLIFPARELIVRERRERDRADGPSFAEPFSNKRNKKVQKAIELIVEEAEHEVSADARIRVG